MKRKINTNREAWNKWH